jgi:chromosome segregation ATPase
MSMCTDCGQPNGSLHLPTCIAARASRALAEHGELDRLRAELAAERDAHGATASELSRWAADLETVRSELAAAEKVWRYVISECDAARAELAEAKEALRDQAQQLDAARADNITYPRLLKEAHDERDAAIERAKRAEADRAHFQRERDILQAFKDATATKPDATYVADLAAHVERQQQATDELRKTSEDLLFANGVLQKTAKRAEAERDAARAERDRSRAHHADTQEFLAQLRTDWMHEAERVQKLVGLLRHTRDTMRTAARWLPRHEDIPDLSREIERLDCEINAAIGEGE